MNESVSSLIYMYEKQENSGVQNPTGTTSGLSTDTAGLPFPPETMGQLPLYQHVYACVCACVRVSFMLVCMCVPVARVPDGPQMGTQAGSSCLLALTCERAASRPRVTAPRLSSSSTLLSHPDSPWITCRTFFSPESHDFLSFPPLLLQFSLIKMQSPVSFVRLNTNETQWSGQQW